MTVTGYLDDKGIIRDIDTGVPQFRFEGYLTAMWRGVLVVFRTYMDGDRRQWEFINSCTHENIA